METNIADYKNNKTLIQYSKKKSPYKISFITTDPDEWFIDVIHYKKTGAIHEVNTIIAKDLEKWKQWIESKGWEEFK